MAGHLSDVDAVCFHDNSHYLATGSIDKAVRLWELRAGPCVRVLSAHTGPVHTLAFSPNGKPLNVQGFLGAFERLLHGNDSHLFTLGIDEANFVCTNTVVYGRALFLRAPALIITLDR